MNQLSEKVSKVFAENKLIGNYYFDEEEYSKMIKYVHCRCDDLISDRNKKNFSRVDYQMIFATIVQIATRWKSSSKSDGSFWKYVSRIIFGEDVSSDSKLKSAFGHIILTLGKDNKLPIAVSGQKYYTTIMMHSFSPQSSIHSFFDLCYNIYKKDLDFGFTTDDEWLCEIVLLQLRNVLGRICKDDKFVSIGSSAYSINVGLRSFVLTENLSGEFLEFIRTTFVNINKLFSREIIEKKTRLDYYIVEWWKNKIETEKLDKELTFKKRTPTVSKHNIIVKYTNSDSGVFLCIPSIRLEDVENKMQLLIFVENEKVYCEEMRTKRGELVVATKELEFNLNELLSNSNNINIEVQIIENDTIIFDSGKSKSSSLNREFILFNGEKEIYSKYNRSTNYFVYTKNIDSFKEYPEYLITCGCNLYNIYPVADEKLTGKTKQVVFINNDKASNLGENICLIGDVSNVEWIIKDTHFTIYKNAIKLMIPENSNLKALELRIDDKPYKLQELVYESIEFGYYQYGLKVLDLIEESVATRISLYSYEKEKVLLDERIILMPNLEIHFNEPFYYGDVERKVTVEHNNRVSELSWNKGESEIIYPINSGDLVIKVPYFKWRINSNEWHTDPINKKLWYKNFVENGDVLEFECSNEEALLSIYAKIDCNESLIPKNQRGQFEIGRYIYTNENYTDISLSFTYGSKSFPLFNIATKEHFIANPITCRKNNVYLNIQDTFVGDIENEFFVIVKNKNKDSIRKKVRVENIELGLLKDNVYKIIVKIKDKSLFSKDDTYTIFFNGQLVVGKSEKFRFRNKYIYIEHVFVRGRGWIIPSQQYIIRDIEYIEQEEIAEQSTEYYLGKLKIAGVNNQFIDYLPNENGGIDKINPVRIELRDSKSFWLVAGYDLEEDDFLGELIFDNLLNKLCNINAKTKQDRLRYLAVSMYKFKEEEYV